ncbi:MAG: hypothetical protein J6B41_07340 [Alistipes sp.]|nr:hypothetical protein [Alistipes sp.]
MARNKGTFNFAANLQVKLQELLDPRGGVTTKAELINKETFPYDGDTIYMKEGMLVSVSQTHEVYMLISLENIFAPDYSGWLQVDASAASQVEVVDSLTSEDATKALSANQGRLLKELIDEVSNKVASIYTPKGSKDKYTDLPADAAVGDVWNVVEAYNGYPAGTNWAWTGTEWDALGGIVDLSNYYNKGEVDGAISAALTPVNTEIGNVKTLAETNQTNLGTLQGEVNTLSGTVSGISASIGTINEKNTAQDNRLTALEELVTGGGGEGEEDQTLLQKVNANTLAIAQLEAATINGMTLVDDEGNAKQLVLNGSNVLVGTNTNGVDASLSLVAAIGANKSAIDTLNGDAETEGSVDYKIANAFKWVEVTA